MTFMHKLVQRLAWLRYLAAIAAATTTAAIVACENLTPGTQPGSSIAQLVISPKNAVLQPNETQDFMAVGFTDTGDSADVTVTWTASSGIIDSSSSGKRHYLQYKNADCGAFKVVATSHPGSLSDTASVTVFGCSAAVASVSVGPAHATVLAGQTAQLAATPKDANGNPLSGRVVTWTSNNTSVATVNGSGLVTGVVAGSATITATSEGQSGTAAITVTTVPVNSVTVSPASASVPAGQTVQLTATPKDASGNPLSGRVVTWTSNNTSVATVNGSGLVTGVVAGAATITATSEGQSGTAVITITNVPVTSVTVSPASASVPAGQTAQLTATPKDASGNPLSGRVVTWTSNNTSVATVNGSGLVTAVVAGSATITATSEGQSGTAAITVTNVPVASVTVSPASASVPAGQTSQLTATPKDASGNPLSGRVVTWTSNNPSVATVSGSGLVTGVVAGSATITATSEGQSGTATITVTPPSSSCPTSSTTFRNAAFATQAGSFTAVFDATPNGAALDAATGLSQGAAAAFTDLAVIVRFNTGGTIDARNGGAYAAANTIPYTAGTSYHFRVVVDVSSHTYSAYVTPAGSSEQTIGSGFAFRTEQSTVASLANWALTAISGSHTVCNFSLTGTTPPAPVASVTVTPASATMNQGQTRQLAATPKDASGSPLSGRVVTWTSNNTSVATVNGSGLVTGVVAGSATITATSEGQSGTAAITVTNVPVASVTVSPASASVPTGQKVQLTATPKDASGNPLSGRVVTWTSNNTSVATVNGSGLVSGVVAGSATITATSEGQSGTAAITVTIVPVNSVTVIPASASVQASQTAQLTATPKDASGNPLSGRVVTWTSNNTSVATVSGSGLVTGVAVGSATITATSEGKSGTSAITVVPVSSSVVLVGAGDIADCNAEPTATLLDGIPGTVFTAGDNAYPNGSAANYTTCYDPSWGRHKARTRPSPGNHEYKTTGATGYFGYFGAQAGPTGLGYYSYDIGAWHIISLNSTYDYGVGIDPSTAQGQWLRADLAANTKRCIVAYWHYPRFSSGMHGSYPRLKTFWDALYAAGATIVINGHDHSYERFGLQAPDGTADPVGGIRQFVVGTGGAGLYTMGTALPNSEVRNNTSKGVLKLTLSDGSYAWQFIPAAGASFTDSGSGTCH